MTRLCNAGADISIARRVADPVPVSVVTVWWKRGLVAAAFLLMPVAGIWLAGAAADSPEAEVTDAPSADTSAPAGQ